jgi:MFS family permease
MSEEATHPLEIAGQRPIRTTQPPSAWIALRHSMFRAVWIATIVSNIGTWMQDVGNAWLMTSLSPSPLLVSLVQAAESLPLFVLALPAGALADVLDRRRVLILSQLWMCVAAAGIGVLTLLGLAHPSTLLLFAALLGIGGALAAPAFQSIVPELVPPEDLTGAVGLNALAVNISRSIGPALGGLVVAAAGPGFAFLLNAASFIFVALVFWRWNRKHPVSTLPAERIISGIRVGVRFVIHNGPLRSILVRNFAFMIGASGLWALVPIVVRGEMHLGPAPYGLLLGCFGMGALLAVNVLPAVRRHIANDGLVVIASVLFAIATFALGVVRVPLILAPFLFLGGAGWVTALGALNVSAQKAVPSWVRSRAIAAYLMVWFGSMTLGSIVWGIMASHYGTTVALTLSAGITLIGSFAAIRYRLAAAADLDLEPSAHWADAEVLIDLGPDRGPVMVQVEYKVRLDAVTLFLDAIHRLRGERLRDGAFSWGIYADTAQPLTYVEIFAVESWIEHLRQHTRVTMTDKTLQDEIKGFLAEGSSGMVRHLIASPTRSASILPPLSDPQLEGAAV